jgi:hypothetical protein
MDPYTIYNTVTAFIDPLVVFMTLIFTEIVKRIIPYEGVVGTNQMPKWINRLMPLTPLFLGMILICIKGRCYPNVDIMIKGFVSGGAAAYLYRTYKVMFLGD